MPYVIRPRGIRRMIGVLLGAAALISLLVPVAAKAACPTQPTSQPFQQFGDSADYFLAPNGGLESGSTGWKLSKASVVTGNETFYVRSRPIADRWRSRAAARRSRRRSAWARSTRLSVSSCSSRKAWDRPDMKIHVRYVTQDGNAQGPAARSRMRVRTGRRGSPRRRSDLYGKLGFSDSTRTTTARSWCSRSRTSPASRGRSTMSTLTRIGSAEGERQTHPRGSEQHRPAARRRHGRTTA